MTRARTQLLAALFACGILAALAPPLPVAVATEVRRGGLNHIERDQERDQLRQQKAAQHSEEAEVRERAEERWLRKLEREADPGADDDSVFDLDESFSEDLFEQD